MRLLAALTRGQRVLDVGYAQWPNADLIRAGRSVSGLDLERPTAPSGYDHEWVGDAAQLSQVLGEREFDTILAAEFIEHLERPYDFLRASHRHVAAGGRLLLSTPNPLAWPTLPFEWAHSRRRFYTEDHTFYFSPRWVRRMLERTGFRLVQVRGVGLWPLGWPCPTALSYQVVYVAEPEDGR